MGLMVTLAWEDRAFAASVAKHRFETCGPPRPLRSAGDMLNSDLVGALAEVGVCRFYGVDPVDQPHPWWGRPGGTADLVLWGYRVAVKATEHWHDRLRLFWPRADESDIAILVSVDLPAGRCWLRGWVQRKEAASYPVLWEYGRSVRHIPLRDLHTCHPRLTPTRGVEEGERGGELRELQELRESRECASPASRASGMLSYGSSAAQSHVLPGGSEGGSAVSDGSRDGRGVGVPGDRSALIGAGE